MGYQQLEVWQAGRKMVSAIYRLTSGFPAGEAFGLTSQLRRAAISIPANIAEGYGRRTGASYAQFLRIAKGSVNELETLLVLSEDLGMIEDAEPHLREAARIGSMLSNLIARIGASVTEDVADYDFDEQPTAY